MEILNVVVGALGRPCRLEDGTVFQGVFRERRGEIDGRPDTITTLRTVRELRLNEALDVATGWDGDTVTAWTAYEVADVLPRGVVELVRT